MYISELTDLPYRDFVVFVFDMAEAEKNDDQGESVIQELCTLRQTLVSQQQPHNSTCCGLVTQVIAS